MASPLANQWPVVTSQSPDDEDIGEPARKRRRGTDGSASITVTHRRKAACQSCRLRKVKCDKTRPTCAVCRASDSECEYLDATVEKLTLETATQSVLERLDRLQDDVDRLNGNIQNQESNAQPVHRKQVSRTLQPVLTPQNSSDESIALVEPSRDFLQIPPHKTSSDTVLTWEIFEGRYPPNALIGVLFEPDHIGFADTPATPTSPVADAFVPTTGLTPPDDERIPGLVDSFLQNVHTKNPILHVEPLVKHARQCAQNGVGWDAWSCLVLITCALGSVAKPFDNAAPLPPVVRRESLELANAPPPSSARLFAKELHQAESCFVLACRRLGSLKHTMLGAQCHFFAGVYLMYTLRPILSWQYFLHASILYQLYLKTTHGIMPNGSDIFQVPIHHLNAMDRKSRRVEQSLYWSCFKSECEFRVELPLPQTEIGTWEYPALFPSPPSPLATDHMQTSVLSPVSARSTLAGIDRGLMDHLTRFDSQSSLNEEERDLRQHAKRLCNEEESWYYYLTEIALRRIGNRIINTFFRLERSAWLNIRPLLRIAQEFEAQVSSWSAHLPPAMLHYETASVIRAPHLNSLNESTSNFVSRELSWATDNRLLEMQTWLYQPFLYHLIHVGGLAPPGSRNPFHEGSPPNGRSSNPGAHQINDLLNPYPNPTTHHPYHLPTTSTLPTNDKVHLPPPSQQLDTEDIAVLRSLIASGIECNLKTMDVRTLRHRHHGLWYDLRSTMCASLILLAVVKSGNAAWIPGGTEILWGPTPSASAGTNGTPTTPGRDGSGRPGKTTTTAGMAPIGGRIEMVLEQFEFWAAESPDLIRHKEVLAAVVRDVRGS